MPCASMFADYCRHNPDRSGTGDQDVLAEHRKRQRRVNRIAERVEDRSDIWIDRFPVHPGVAGRQRDVIGESAGEVDTNDASVDAEMAPTRPAVATPPTDQVAFAAHQIADRDVGDAGADLNHLAGELMAHGHRWLQSLLRPFVPRLDMQVSAA